MPTPSELATLYTTVGRELASVSRVDPAQTAELWPRYRWIRFQEAIRTTEGRAAAAQLLSRLLADLRATTRARGSAAD